MVIEGKDYSFAIIPRACRQSDKFDFFVDITNNCNAQCLFCCNDNTNSDALNLQQLEADFNQIKSNVSRIVISGGEPLLDVSRLESLLELVLSFGVNIKLITNGYKLDEHLLILEKYRIKSMQVSRHHYNDLQNNILFGAKMLSFENFGYILNQNKNLKFSLNCLLIKGYIDSVAEITKFLEHCSQIGITSVKFVGLMKVNDFCKENYVDYNGLISSFPMDFLQTNKRADEDRCSCANYIYVAENGMVIKTRFRHIAKFTNTNRVVRFTPNGIGRF